MNITDQIYKAGVIPVVEIDNAINALPLAQALTHGGLPICEITLRTSAAIPAIYKITQETREILVGAGTVTNQEQALLAVNAGAKFLVSPGLAEDVARWAIENNIPYFPGTITPTEIMRAINLGLKILKFFPAETIGGIKAIKAMSDPFPGIKFIPTGGIRLENMREYLQDDRIFAVGGSWMCKRSFISEGKFSEIEKSARQAVTIVQETRN